jgi:hypothetical protein
MLLYCYPHCVSAVCVCQTRHFTVRLQVVQLEMERFSLSKGLDTDKATANRKAGLDRQLKQLKRDQKVGIFTFL